MQKGVILGCGNRSNAGMDTITLPPHHTWESLEFNLGVGSITLCMVPQSSQLCGPGLPATTWI
jgi:hypothetical protein